MKTNSEIRGTDILREYKECGKILKDKTKKNSLVYEIAKFFVDGVELFTDHNDPGDWNFVLIPPHLFNEYVWYYEAEEEFDGLFLVKKSLDWDKINVGQYTMDYVYCYFMDSTFYMKRL